MQNFITKIFRNDIYQLSNDRPVEPRVEKKIWPSEAMVNTDPFSVGECRRSVFYKILGIQPTDDMSIRVRSICDAGIASEEYQINKYKERSMFISEQYRIQYFPPTENGIMFSGKMDCVINFDGKNVGIELKSVAGFRADDILGNSTKLPLPSANNLIQTMLYKYYFKYTDEGKVANIDDVYIQYVNRSDWTTFFYKIDLDEQGYVILTAYNQGGGEVYTMRLQDQASYSDLISRGTPATSEESRLAELRFSIHDIFSKCDSVYSYVKNMSLPPCDYKLSYDIDDVKLQYQSGRISKLKYNKAIKSGECGGDFKCAYCSYQKQCLSDSGIEIKIK